MEEVIPNTTLNDGKSLRSIKKHTNIKDLNAKWLWTEDIEKKKSYNVDLKLLQVITVILI